MNLVVTDDRRRRQMRERWLMIASGGEDDPIESDEPTELPSPPIPSDLYGFRDSGTESTVGCFDFSPPNNTGITQVNVYRGTVSGGPYVLIGSFDVTLNSQIFDTGLDADTDYFYVLRSLGDGIAYLAEESANSAEIEIAVLGDFLITEDGDTLITEDGDSLVVE